MVKTGHFVEIADLGHSPQTDVPPMTENFFVTLFAQVGIGRYRVPVVEEGVDDERRRDGSV
jgi:hypothetical protein